MIFLVDKMREAFVPQKLLTFFNKNIGIFEILTFEILTKRQLTTSLVLNNWAQESSSVPVDGRNTLLNKAQRVKGR